MASHRRGTCCSVGRCGNTRAAQPAPAAATTVQLVWLREMSSRNGRTPRDTACCTAPDELGRLVLQLIGIVGVDGQDGVPGLGVFEERLGQPGRELAERVARGVLKPHQLERFVAPDDLDQRRARLVGAGHDVPDEGRRFERRAAAGQRSDDQQALAGPEIEAHPDGELAVGLKARFQICRHWHSVSQPRGPRQPRRACRARALESACTRTYRDERHKPITHEAMSTSTAPSEYRVEKRRADATVTLSSGTAERGCFFLASSSTRHDGPERVADLLNSETGFFPFEIHGDDGVRTVLYHRSHVVFVTHRRRTRRRSIPATASPRGGSSRSCSRTAQRIIGAVRVYRPEGRDRLSDWARQPETFRYIETGDATIVVNFAHIVEVSEVAGVMSDRQPDRRAVSRDGHGGRLRPAPHASARRRSSARTAT